MVKSTKKAFTLVELIVVITILAILGTIAFISLQGYSAEARDSKRLTNVNDITRKINIEIVRGAHPKDLISISTASGGTWATTKYLTSSASYTNVTFSGVEMAQGYVYFPAIQANGEQFRDPSDSIPAQDYPFAYAIGWTGSGAFSLIQMATVSESKNQAVVVWNYFQMNGMPVSIIETATGTTYVEDGKLPLPYNLSRN